MTSAAQRWYLDVEGINSFGLIVHNPSNVEFLIPWDFEFLLDAFDYFEDWLVRIAPEVAAVSQYEQEAVLDIGCSSYNAILDTFEEDDNL